MAKASSPTAPASAIPHPAPLPTARAAPLLPDQIQAPASFLNPAPLPVAKVSSAAVSPTLPPLAPDPRADRNDDEAFYASVERAERIDEIRKALSENECERKKLNAELAELQKNAPPGATRRARVTVPQSHVGVIEVEISADAADPTSAAIHAAKAKMGIVNFGSGPLVTFED